MKWGIQLNWEHVAVWRGRLYAWWTLMIFSYFTIKGARLDELMFVCLAVPAVFLVGYGSICFLIASVKLLLTVGRDRPSRAKWRHSFRLRRNPACSGTGGVSTRDDAIWKTGLH